MGNRGAKQVTGDYSLSGEPRVQRRGQDDKFLFDGAEPEAPVAPQMEMSLSLERVGWGERAGAVGV